MKKLLNMARQRLIRAKDVDAETAKAPADDASRLAIAAEKLKGRDKVGVVGESAVVAGSVAAGVAVSGTVAGAAGATTLLGSTSLAGMLGGVFVTTTPIGWVLGSAAVAGVAGYGLVKLVRSGTKQDQVREQYRGSIAAQQKDLQAAGQHNTVELHDLVAKAIACSALDPATAQSLTTLVETGRVSESLAIERVKELLDAQRAGDIQSVSETGP